MFRVYEKEVKAILTKSKINGIDYTICPYIGCSHGCIYCYVRFMGFMRSGKWGNEWGRFVSAKINSIHVLKKQLKKINKGSKIYISTATDPYQPIEKKYLLTRQILKELAEHKLYVSLLTKSVLVLRDIDILKRLYNVEVGFTITTINEDLRAFFEPYASSIKDRFLALRTLEDAGIKIYVFIAPILPYFTEYSLGDFFQRCGILKLDRIVVDRLNYIKKLRLDATYYPHVLKKYKHLENEYFERIKYKIIKYCKEYNIRSQFCF